MIAAVEDQAIRLPQREIEALVGSVLLNTVGRALGSLVLMKSKLVPKEAVLPRSGYVMHYLEREAVLEDVDDGTHDASNRPTLLFFHGITGKADDFAQFVSSLDIDPRVRILVPEQIGHGRDVERAKNDPESFEHPTHERMLETTCEFLDVVRAGNNCNAFGISMGGAVCYYVHRARPDVIQRSILVSPAILACVDRDLLDGIRDGTNRFLRPENREDIKMLFRDLSTGRDDDGRKKRDPVPKFLLESIYRASKKAAPEGYNKAMLASLLRDGGSADQFSAVTDVDPGSRRLVIWPEKDRIISYEQGKRFFEVSTTEEGGFVSKSANTQFETVPDCGHVFHADGKGIFEIIRARVREYILTFD